MMTSEILNIIYTKNLNGEPITEEELLKLGLNHNDISELLEKNIIKQAEEKIYGLKETEDLFNYGIYLLKQNEFSKAYAIFNICHNIEPNNLKFLEYLFLCSIKKNTSVEEQRKILEKLIDSSPKKRRKLNNIYMYFWGYISLDAKKETIKIIKALRYKDLKLFDENVYEKENFIAYNINEVISQLGNVDDNQYLTTYQKEIVQELINKVLTSKKRLNVNLLELIEQENYEKVINILEHRNSFINLEVEYKIILLLVNKIKDIIKKDKIPRPIVKEDCRKNIIAMIENNYFEKAYDISVNRINSNNSKEEDKIIHMLLSKIKKIIETKKNKENANEVFRLSMINLNIENIISKLTEKKIEEAIDMLKKYLNEIGEEQYSYLVINIIKIYYTNENPDYNHLVTILTEINDHEYEYNLTHFLEMFYQSLNLNRIETARIYLKIIKRYTPKEVNIFESLNKDIEKAIKRMEEESKFVEKYLMIKLSEMEENNLSAIIIDVPMPHSIRNIIYKTIKNSPIRGLRAFGIGEEPKRVVLRYLNQEQNGMSRRTKDYKGAYSKKEYQKCIDIIKKLLKDYRYDGYNPHVYAYLGLSYYHLSNFEEAYKYLKISHSLNREPKFIYDKSMDFSELISELEKKLNIETISDDDRKLQSLVTDIIKRTTKRTTKTIELKDRYEALEDFANYLKESKIKLSEAVTKYHLSEEDIEIITLIYVKDYYILSMYKEGDSLLREIEKKKNKTPYVINLIDEIRKNKLFYKHRIDAYKRIKNL